MEIADLLQARVEELSFYSPYSFLREFSPEQQVELFIKPKIDQLLAKLDPDSCTVDIAGNRFVFVYEFMLWDSSFFNRPCYKLFAVLHDPCSPSVLIEAIIQFKGLVSQEEGGYCFIDIPSEDTVVIQCLNQAGFKMVETRLHYYKSNLADFQGERHPVREATSLDNEALSQLAAQQRNPFDRTHADTAFSTQEADAYLARYAQEAVKGFCTGVLVPNKEESILVDAFLAYTLYQESLPSKLLKRYHVALTAVGPTYKGGLYKLLSELVHLAKDKEARFVTYTTQSTNRAAIRTCEKLGFEFARATHILSFSS
jgi:dTDP-4-amino-4,6-dideoxy-D-galactose acyltransferase